MSRMLSTYSTVHPRVGGEHAAPNASKNAISGSSPRGRGTPQYGTSNSTRDRFIPAWAGNTHRRSKRRFACPVHPRVGGEHDQRTAIIAQKDGSSPRGRGTLTPEYSRMFGSRFIPAWAGNTPAPSCSRRSATVHPRVGGEHPEAPTISRLNLGSSPRGRGTLRYSLQSAGANRFIPAWAGNTTSDSSTSNRVSVHPRVGGEHMDTEQDMLTISGSSPRGRGTHLNRSRTITTSRFIPAWAGNTRRRPTAPAAAPVHPRVGGEHPRHPSQCGTCPGSSPRGRGTQK